ncbi:MAG: rhomboid family intramembrane serine protease [Actinobacteria bacterium]|nr:rhomboid family intramembrane serine protease [Actinomycetota bacterium]
MDAAGAGPQPAEKPGQNLVIPLRDENPTTRTPLITLLIIAANVFIFFAVQPQDFGMTGDLSDSAAAEGEQTEFLYRNAAIPCEVRQLEPLSAPQIQTGECQGPFVEGDPFFPDKSVLLSVLASMFLHGGLLHLGGNMLFLWIFGNNIEERFGVVGYVTFYVFAGLVATAAHVLTQANSTIPVIGASGAIAGVMGAYLVFFPQARVLSLVPIFFFIQIVRLPAAAVLGLWFVMQFFTNPNSGVAWAAHVGGFLAGAAVAFLLRPLWPRPAPAPAADWG